MDQTQLASDNSLAVHAVDFLPADVALLVPMQNFGLQQTARDGGAFLRFARAVPRMVLDFSQMGPPTHEAVSLFTVLMRIAMHQGGWLRVWRADGAWQELLSKIWLADDDWVNRLYEPLAVTA